MATATATNGNPQRKQLSDQIDRLDALLDGLSEGLNEAVADAVREGTRLALKDAMIEIMTDPVLRAKLHEVTAPDKALGKKPGFWARFKARLAATGRLLGGAAVASVNAAKAAAAQTVRAVRAAARPPLRWLSLLANARQILGVGVGTGLIVATIALAAPHEFAAAISGISGAIAAMSLRSLLWMRRAAESLVLA